MSNDSSCRHDPNLAFNRRELLGRCGMGFGLIGLAGIMADDNLLGPDFHGECRIDRAAWPVGGEVSSFPRESQAGRPPVHERWTVAGRHF